MEFSQAQLEAAVRELRALVDYLTARTVNLAIENARLQAQIPAPEKGDQ